MGQGSNPDIDVVVGAETSGVEAGMHRAASAVDAAIQAMGGSTGALGATIGAVSGVVGELTQTLMTSLTEGLKEAAKAFTELTGTVEKFSFATGDSLRDSSILADALSDIGVSTQTYEGIVSRVSRAIRTNDEAFARLGITIKDSSTNALLPMNQIIQNTVQRLEQFKAGSDRNAASMELLRSNWKELAPLLRVNKELMDSNTEAAERLGMVIGEKDLEAMHEFQLAVADAKKPLEGMWVTIGRSLNPLLIELAGILKGVLTFAFDVVTGAVRGVITFLEYLQNGFYAVAELAIMSANVIGTSFTAIGSALGKAVRGDFTGAVAELKSGLSGIEADVKASLDNILAHSQRTQERVKHMWLPNEQGAGGQGGTETYKPKDKTGKKDTGGFDSWKKELQEQKDAADVFRGMELEAEKAFWQEKLKLVRGGGESAKEDRRRVSHEISQIEKKEAQNQLKDALQALSMKKDEVSKHKDEVVRIETARAELLRSVYGEDSQQYKEALRAKLKAERDFQEELRQIKLQSIEHEKALQDIGFERARDRINFEKDIGLITNEQRLASLSELLEAEHNAEREAISHKLLQYEEGTIQHQQMRDKLELIDQQYFLKLQQLQQQQAMESTRIWGDILGTISSAIETSVKGIISGTTTMQKALANIWNAILSEFINFLMKMFLEWVKRQILMTIFGQKEEATRSASTIAAAIAEAAAVKAKAIAEISAYAGTAGAAATASAAAIPVTGWMIAPAAGAAAAASAMSYMAMAAGPGFAVGSWKVPEDMVTKVHKGETIVPEEFAERYREGEGAGGGVTNINISAVDARSIRDYLKRNSHSVAPSLKSIARNFTSTR